MNFVEFKVRFVLGTIRLFGKLPLKFHYFWGDVVASLMKDIFHYRRDVVIANLARSFPEKNYHEIRSIASAFYRHLGEIVAETIWFGGSDYKRLHNAGICEIENLEVLTAAYESSPSVTVLCSHCGNWEIIGGLWAYNYNPEAVFPSSENCIKVVYKRLHNPVWDEVLKRNRCAPIKGFDGEVESSQILRYSLKHRSEKNVYVYPTDQYPYASVHDVGTFLSQPTKGMLGGVGVAHKLGMSVLYMKMKNTGRGHYVISFIPICADASEMAPELIVRKYFDLLEEEIRETPYNWLWSHKRWKK